MGQFDNFSGGVALDGQMYLHGDDIKFHTASKAYDIASGNEFLKIEPRTDDPASPELGRIWLRTDLP